MKRMVYESEWKHEILDRGEHKGIEYAVVSYGHHPCAYIKVPKDSRHYGCRDDKLGYLGVPLGVHGGLTFGDNLTHLNDAVDGGEPFGEDDYWLGWDYAHCDDYTGSGAFHPTLKNNKRWTVEEILGEVRSAIDQLLALE